MRNLSSAFRHEIYYNGHSYEHLVDIKLADNTVLPTITNSTLWTGGFSFDDAVSDDNTFTALGSTIIGAAKVIINNIDGAYSEYDFTNAIVELSLSKTFIVDGNETTETIHIGKYTTDECVYNGGTITLSLLDNMEKFDRPYNASYLPNSATLFEIVYDACTQCGVRLATQVFPHYDYSVPVKINDEAVTFRQVLGWVATIAGCFARCNADGDLELKWFDTVALESLNDGLDGGVFDSDTPYSSGDSADGGSFNPWNTGDEYDAGQFSTRDSVHYINNLYSQTIGVDDIVITGISITVEGTDESGNKQNKEYKFGTDGYRIKIEGNKLIVETEVNTIGTWLANAIVGMRFRNVNITHIDDLAIEAGDIGLVTDRKQNDYAILITRTSYSAGGSQTTICGAESPSRNSASRFSQATQAYVDARNLLNVERSAREAALADLSERLDETSGLYSTLEVTQSGTIYYLHDKPRLEDSLIIWKMTTEAWGVSTDGGTTWNAGMTVDGNVIANILNAIGVNANWIRSGELKIETTGNNRYTVFSANANTKIITILAKDSNNETTFSLDSSTGAVIINASQFSLSGTPFNTAVDNRVNAIVPSAVSTAVNSAIQQDLNQTTIYNILTNNDANQGLYLYNNKIYLNWEYAHGQVLQLGDDSLFSGTTSYLQYMYQGQEMGTWTQNGLMIRDYYAVASGISWDRTWIKGSNIYSSYKMVTYEDGNWHGGGSIELAKWSTSDNKVYFNINKAETDAIRIDGPVQINYAYFKNVQYNSSTSNIMYATFTPDVFDINAPWQLTYTNLTPSSKRYKNVGRLVTDEDIQEAYNIKVYMAQYKEGVLKETDERYHKTYPMFIAEQMEQHLPISVDHDVDGQCETWNDRVLIPFMFQMIKSQKNQLDKQQKKIEDLEERLAKLEALLK